MSDNIILTDKDIIRFWSKVCIKDKESCWEWLYSTNSNGYGQFQLNYKNEQSHKVAFVLYYKRQPVKLVCHKCDNKLCCNPRHLYEGTYLDNMFDTIDRHKRYDRKFTDEEIAKIKKLELTHSQRELAIMFNVSQSTIFRVQHGETYKRRRT